MSRLPKGLPALAILTYAATALAALSDLAELERIEVTTAPEVTVTLQLSQPGAVSATTLPADSTAPDRIVVQLGLVRIGRSTRSVGGGGVLRRVRTEPIDASTARVVLELARPTEFRIDSRGSVVVVTLMDGALRPRSVPQVEPPIVPPP